MNKRVILWLIILVGVLAVILLFTLSGCNHKKDAPLVPPVDETPIAVPVNEFSLINGGPLSNVSESGINIIDNMEGYNQFVDSHSMISLFPPDFDKEVMVVVFMGYRPTGGYEVDIRQVEEKDGVVYVYAFFRSPGDNCMTIQQITEPYQAISIPKTNLPIEVIKEIDIYDCP